MSDLISRQAAIDAMAELQGSTSSKGVLKGISKAWKRIEQLPPIQPVNNSENPNSSEAISRQKAIDALRTMQTYKLFAGDDMLLIDQAGAQTELMLLPPIQPEIVRCKDCKHWKDSDGVFRRGTGAESKCPLNLHQVYEGTFFCGLAERREVTT